jgi:hypothetical protein
VYSKIQIQYGRVLWRFHPLRFVGFSNFSKLMRALNFSRSSLLFRILGVQNKNQRMVVFQIKKSDTDTFLYEASCDMTSDHVVRELTEIWNLRLRLSQLCGAIREMGRHGPMKHPDKAGLDEIATSYGGAAIERGEYYEADPTGMRTGNGVGPQLMETIERVAHDAESVLTKDMVARKFAVSLPMLQEKLDNMRGAVTMCKYISPCLFSRHHSQSTTCRLSNGPSGVGYCSSDH